MKWRTTHRLYMATQRNSTATKWPQLVVTKTATLNVLSRGTFDCVSSLRCKTRFIRKHKVNCVFALQYVIPWRIHTGNICVRWLTFRNGCRIEDNLVLSRAFMSRSQGTFRVSTIRSENTHSRDPVILTEAARALPHSFQVLRLGHSHFLQNKFQFVYLPIIRRYIVWLLTDSVVKHPFPQRKTDHAHRTRLKPLMDDRVV
jgi:hypothetical protein